MNTKRKFSKLYFGNLPSDTMNHNFYSTNQFVNTEKPKTKKINKKQKKNGDHEDDEDDDSESTPFPFPNLFKDDDNYIYLKENHLYFHTDVNQESVDEVKKLMRDYSLKIKRIKNLHSCVDMKPKPLYLHIFSPGGDVYSGLALYDFIVEYKKKIPVHTVVEGIAASAATFISIAGSVRYITPSSYMLIHQLSTMMSGNFEQLKDEFDNSLKLMNKIMEIYELHCNITKKKIPKILKHDLIWDATECKKQGLVDEIKLIDIFNDDCDDVEDAEDDGNE